MTNISRRHLMKASAGTLAGATALGLGNLATAVEKKGLNLSNDFFYDADGKFDVEKGKDGILKLCDYFGYPVFDGFREGLWVSDYNTGQFTKLGLAAYMFMNNVKGEYSYMLMDLFLMPNQMLPEHWHLTPEEGAAKNEGWLIRWGQSNVVGVGEANLPDYIEIPKIHMSGTVTTYHNTVANPGDFVPLAKVGSRHWQYAGPEGAIITEVANAHDDPSVRHSDPELNKYFLGG